MYICAYGNLLLKLVPVMNELNDLLDDDSTGGGEIGGHGLTLGMHLLHELQSDRKFTDLFTTRQDFEEINCLSVFHQQLKVNILLVLYLYTFMSMYIIYMCLLVCLSSFLISSIPFIHLSTHPSTHPSIYPSIHSSLFPFF